jgi:hypothetical protein
MIRKATKRLALATLGTGLGLFALSSTAFEVSDDSKQQTIAQIATLMKQHYVFPETAETVSDKLVNALKNGEFNSAVEAEDFAKALTDWLHANAKDKHLRVMLNSLDGKQQGLESRIRKSALTPARPSEGSFGVASVQKLENNIGYLELTGFRSIQGAKDYLDAAMKILASADAVIIDLRKNGGGDPATVQYLASYFFSEPVLLNSLYYRVNNSTTDYFVLEHVDGEKMPNVPLFVLTSGSTFSAAEEFSYNIQTQKRGTLVGETTGGGANPGGVFAINNDFRMFIATGKAVNPITKTNWEGTGVKPEVETTAEDALEKAKALAAETIEKNWQRTIATRTMALDEFFDIVNQLNKEQKSHDKLVKQYQSKLTSNIKTLGLGRRELSQLVNLNFESNPQTAAVFIQIAINQSPKEVRLYQALADALVNAEQVEAAKNAVRQGIANAANDDDKQQLHDKLAAIGTEQTSL